jgi:uncharacterized membrane protein
MSGDASLPIAYTPTDRSFLWRSSVRYVAAVVVALFPFLFYLDDAVRWPLSPMLPGLGILFLIAVAAPLAVTEIRARRVRRSETHEAARLLRSANTSWAALGIALIWFALWLAGGL